MRTLRKILILSSLVVFFSCEKIIDMDIPDGEHKIVVNSLFSDNDSSLLVHISQSLHVLDKTNQLNLSGAEVKLYEDNVFLATLDSVGEGFFSIDSWPLAVGKKYEIEVSCTGLASVNAINIIPEKVFINQFDTSSVVRYQTNLIECRMKINDPVNIKNFYIVKAIAYIFEESEKYEYLVNLISDDPIVEEYLDWGDSGFMFSDELINGKNYELVFYCDEWAVSSWSDAPVIVEFFLETVSEDYFKYTKSYSKHKLTKNDPFAEPVQVFCNVKNGFGIFAGYSSDIKTMEFVGYNDDTMEE